MTAEVVCFGEMLIRLNAPDHELLLQSGNLRAWVGGAEANVAVSLACLGHATSMVSVVPDNSLGQACVSELRRRGVDTTHVRVTPGRLGIYFMATGAGHRPSEIIYDRADSAFAVHADRDIDWERVLQGAQWLHLSGITPALSELASGATLRSAQAARRLGVRVSFDCNYRAKLWEAARRTAAESLRELIEQADLVFADHRALELVLGLPESQGTAQERFARAAAKALDLNSRLSQVATMQRIEHSVDRHELSGSLASRAGVLVTQRSYSLELSVDRIGAGDAFSAGLLHGLLTSMSEKDSLEFALAAACLKHSVSGDFNLMTPAQVGDLLANRGYAVRR
jgi:2-dehydro-3-deoxygluconokinase